MLQILVDIHLYNNQLMFQQPLYPHGFLSFGVTRALDFDIYKQLAELQEKYSQLETENRDLREQLQDEQAKGSCISERKDCERIDKRKERRTLQNLERNYKCPYQGCRKEYASDLAVNLHIKTKHNGGTKTFREALARQIVLAEQKGDPMPEVVIAFPPGYLKNFKKKFFNEI